MRVKSKWSNKGRQRTLFETGGAAAFILWRIAQQGLLNLENEGFQTDTRSQRMDVIAEFLAFLVHLTDRSKAEALDQNERQEFIGSLAKHLANTMQENRADVEGSGDYRGPLIELLNERGANYAECPMPDGEPGYAMKRYLGECISAVMGEKDNKWITDQVMDVEVPEVLKPLNKALRELFSRDDNAPPGRSRQ
ncbi:hypothetical protein N9235_01760 [Gammaproteobacteria bacterium]|nr:hypothetical protein [Gammaproteobacteria bacterium]